MLKVYGISGRTTAIIRIPAGKSGKAFLECEFTRGRMGLSALANRPATYVTKDPVKQAIIENSPLFGHTIRLVRSYGIEEEQKEQVSAVSAGISAPEGPMEVPGVITLDEAIAYLKAHGAKAVNLASDTAIKKYMAKIGVTFPNATF